MIGLVVIAILMSVNFMSCKDDDDDAGNDVSIVGTWVDFEDEDYLTITFKSDNTWSWDMEGWIASGTYSISGKKLEIVFVKSSSNGAYSQEDLPVKKQFEIYTLTNDRLQYGNDGPSDPDYDLKRK